MLYYHRLYYAIEFKQLHLVPLIVIFELLNKLVNDLKTVFFMWSRNNYVY